MSGVQIPPLRPFWVFIRDFTCEYSIFFWKQSLKYILLCTVAFHTVCDFFLMPFRVTLLKYSWPLLPDGCLLWNKARRLWQLKKWISLVHIILHHTFLKDHNKSFLCHYRICFMYLHLNPKMVSKPVPPVSFEWLLLIGRYNQFRPDCLQPL